MRQIIFTDLDGTMLDPETYSYQKALAAVELLKAYGVPIIFCSAKTRAEQQVYRRELGIFHPFIVEGGAAIFIPKGYFPFQFHHDRVRDDFLSIELAMPYRRTRQLLDKIKKENRFAFRGFGDMSVVEVAKETGLSMQFARLAKQREYSEAIRLDCAALDVSKVLSKFEEAGLSWTYGGRLYHVMLGEDKGMAVEILSALYRRMWGEIITIGLGDSSNDLPMLSRVNIPILVQKRGNCWESLDLPRLRKVAGVGPEGWSKAIVEVFKSQDRIDAIAQA